MSDLDTMPVFRRETYDELGAYLSERVAATDRAQIVIEPMFTDDLPGRRVVCNGELLCRVIPDPSDPRPLPLIVHRVIDKASEATAAR